MKKRIFPIAAVLLFVLSLSAQAVSIQSIQKSPSLTFEGKTAICYAAVTSGNSSDAITVHISLWCGDSLMGSWSGSGSGRATAYGECSAVSGQTYKLTLNSTINGVAQVPEYVIGAC